MLFNGLFNEMDPAQTAAVLSCFVCDERSNEMPKMSGELSGPLRTMQDMAKRIASVSKEAKIEIDEEEYVQKFKPYMIMENNVLLRDLKFVKGFLTAAIHAMSGMRSFLFLN